MNIPLHLKGYRDHKLADILILDISDLVIDFKNKWNQIIDSTKDFDQSFRPNFEMVVRSVIESVRQEIDAEQDLSIMAYHDIISLAYYDITEEGKTETYNVVNVKLSHITVEFGKAVISRLKGDGVYNDGYLPYRFYGWVGKTAVIALDEQHGGIKQQPNSESRTFQTNSNNKNSRSS